MKSATQITSPDNAQFKQLKRIAQSARERRKLGQTLLDGVHLLGALIDAGSVPRMVILRAGAEGQQEIADCCARCGDAPVLVMSDKLFDTLSPVDTPVGILALIDIPKRLMDDYLCAVLLENIQDPGNLGGILRTSAAAGINAAFLSEGCAEAWSPKALRAGMGAQFAIAIHEAQSLADAAKTFHTVVATSLKGTRSIYDIDLTGSVAFLYGNEGAGLTPAVLRCATHVARIPMPGSIESLNVGAAAAVCLFERVRQLSKR